MKRRLTIALLLLGAISLALSAQEPQATLTKDSLAMLEAGFGTGIEERILIGKAESFNLGDRVYFWSRLSGGAPGDSISHVWYLEDRELQSINLHVDASPWRTWSYKTMFPDMNGNWRVEVRTDEGRVLGSYSFHCVE
jgi:hypothetical protein